MHGRRLFYFVEVFLTSLSSICFLSIRTPLQISTYYFQLLLLEEGPILLPTRRTTQKQTLFFFIGDTEGGMTTVAVGRSFSDLNPMTFDLIFLSSDRPLRIGLNVISQVLTDNHQFALLHPSKQLFESTNTLSIILSITYQKAMRKPQPQ